MAKRKTRVLLELVWDDEVADHPAGWDFRTLIEGDPFTAEGTTQARLVTFEDVDENNRPEQV